METPPAINADAIDTRLALQVYAAAATLVGLTVIAWGPRWFGSQPLAAPWLEAALIRTFGATIVAAGCLAAGLAAAGDPLGTRRGLVWLVVAHGVVAVVLVTQRIAVWGPGRAGDLAIAIVAMVVVTACYVLVTSEGELEATRPSLTTLFGAGGRSAATTLRSQYERQIREAARQEERNRLARDLHDSVKQQLFAIHTAAAAAQARLGADAAGVQDALEQVRSSAREATTEMEAMLDQLRAPPLAGSGLADALARQCEALQFRTGARVRFTHDPLPSADGLAPGAPNALFRVAQEALSNVARHARATTVEVSLAVAAGRMTLEIQDNGAGTGPDRPQSGMGIANMKDRAAELGGTLTVAQRQGGGTIVRCIVPYTRPDDRVEVSRQLLRRAAIWGVVLAFNMLFSRSPFFLTLVAIGTIGLVRSLVGYRRIAHPREVAR